MDVTTIAALSSLLVALTALLAELRSWIKLRRGRKRGDT